MCRPGEVRLWSRNGKDFTGKFPDVQAALADQVDIDCVLDGELVVWTGERMDFDALQQRMVNTAATVRRRFAPPQPASLVVFDLLAVDSVDVRPMRWTARRKRLESLAGAWRPPLQLSPVTADVSEAREWLEVFKASGVEGLVVKGATTRYLPAAGTGSRSILLGCAVSVHPQCGCCARPARCVASAHRARHVLRTGGAIGLVNRCQQVWTKLRRPDRGFDTGPVTARDTTKGEPRPLGERGAGKADSLPQS